ncbi:MAG TPA: NADH-quinone oxidoreductase subunit C [Vicinamibacterales bacterium]|nr:NADH-quinone oxidoreductase subunit C [Vicinamibacterales bacterium]
MSTVTTAIAAALRIAEYNILEPRPGEVVTEVHAADLPALADAAVADLDGRLLSLFAVDERATRGRFVVRHVWSLPRLGTFLCILAPVDPAASSFPSIAARHPAANWFEREVMDYFGVVPRDHPNPERVAVHDDWPEGAWAMRKDFDADTQVPRVDGNFHPFRPVTGEGVFQIPVGPVHAGIIEPGHFRFGVAGEPVLYLQLRLFYVHKGTEKRFERLPWPHTLFLAESISGDTAVGHALAYSHAIERLAGVEVPARAQLLRVVLLELERLYNHIADIGALATDVAFTVPASHAQTQREGLVRLYERLFGTRLLRGTIAFGGVKHDLTPDGSDALRRHLRTLEREFDSLITLLIDSGSFTDRVDTTGILSNQVARDLGIVGMAARASGIDADLRRDHPHDAYAKLRFEVPVETGGDVRARLMVRAREVEQSLLVVHRALDMLPETPLRATMPDALPADSAALGWAEAWRGPCVHWVATDERGRLTRVKITDPSFLNWPGLTHAVPGNIIPDFPVINKSFNLSYSGNDR